MAEAVFDLPNIKTAQLDVPTMDKLTQVGDLAHRPRILLLYGSLREHSFSRFLTEEAARRSLRFLMLPACPILLTSEIFRRIRDQLIVSIPVDRKVTPLAMSIVRIKL